jgi:hypothetical protein
MVDRYRRYLAAERKIRRRRKPILLWLDVLLFCADTMTQTGAEIKRWGYTVPHGFDAILARVRALHNWINELDRLASQEPQGLFLCSERTVASMTADVLLCYLGMCFWFNDQAKSLAALIFRWEAPLFRQADLALRRAEAIGRRGISPGGLWRLRSAVWKLLHRRS